MFVNLLYWFLLIVPSLVSVAFATLIERKILSYIQIRKGPLKVSFLGILQPLADALKLFMKEISLPIFSNFILFLLSPLLSMVLCFFMWCIVSFEHSFDISFYSMFFFLIVVSLNVYPLLFSGWSSNNKFSMLGAVRGIVQTLAYEINLTLILFFFMFISVSWDFSGLLYFNNYNFLGLVLMNVFLVVFILLLMETNRTPFDFSEGESELVSGFNIEYSSGIFSLIFLAEYTSIMFFNMFLALVLLFKALTAMMSYIFLMFFFFAWVWVRSTFPRFRYDIMMETCWKLMLPILLIYGIFLLSFLLTA